MKRHAPATQRNREPLLAVLQNELPEKGLLLEVAAGTGEHAAYFAQRLPDLDWQPTDGDAEALESIAAWRAESGAANLLPPFRLDASSAQWPLGSADAILCINMVHISPPEAATGLMAGAGRILPQGAPLLLYGPFIEPDVDTAPSNLDFDASLKARDPRWGLRDTDWMDELAARHGLHRTNRIAMPANNIVLVYRKA